MTNAALLADRPPCDRVAQNCRWCGSWCASTATKIRSGRSASTFPIHYIPSIASEVIFAASEKASDSSGTYKCSGVHNLLGRRRRD